MLSGNSLLPRWRGASASEPKLELSLNGADESASVLLRTLNRSHESVKGTAMPVSNRMNSAPPFCIGTFELYPKPGMQGLLVRLTDRRSARLSLSPATTNEFL